MNSLSEQTKMKVVVATLTCGRDKSLRRLLTAFVELRIPRGIEPLFLVIDNGGSGSVSELVAPFQAALGNLEYLVESMPGIPYARNAAIGFALAKHSNALCFIDDDEEPHPLWLEKITACWLESGADLVGGPVTYADSSSGKSLWRRFVNRSLISRQNQWNRRIQSNFELGKPFSLATNNWLCGVEFLRKSGIQFDPTYQFSGGSDSAFFKEAVESECQVYWCQAATVVETLEDDRISLRYQLKRAKSQSINHFRLKRYERTVAVISRTITAAAFRVFSGFLLFLIPVWGFASPVIAIRSIGWGLGRFEALRGVGSNLYKRSG